MVSHLGMNNLVPKLITQNIMKLTTLLTVLYLPILLAACGQQSNESTAFAFVQEVVTDPVAAKKDGILPIDEYVAGKGYEKYERAIFAGGCFWCTEASFERINGVIDVISGYSGGKKKYPTYKQVGAGQTNHAEAIIIFYDPAVVSYEKLLEVFYVAHDGTQLNRQGPDVGRQYRSAIYYIDEKEKELASNYIAKLDKSGKYNKPIVTEIEAYTEFWVAEDYHQDYYENNPNQRYVYFVSRPKVEKVEKVFADILKKEYIK